MNMQSLCDQCSNVLHGQGSVHNGVCSITIPRHIAATIQGRWAKGAIHAGVTFESFDEQGFALNLGEFVILEEELHSFTQALLQQGIVIGAIHNHWIFTSPTLLYVHFQSIDLPIQFAQKTANAMQTLRSL
ncbi:DUF1259 domain-containing protein [Shouchella sp. JSM 1781072]|uniref:DUF1259 domain-containing protein n=1 Tax=Shouchella sp. JSM 1781072 TaxID=3344581 RepID=UPI0035BF432B